ncbi:MAG: RidA family protein [Armatimonadetes bacterium]|nr:RidA family protein [Armatimonadota bacterium]
MKTVISTPDAPAAIGPYSQAIKANGFLFLSGQIPMNPKTGQIEVVDCVGQTRQVMENIKAVLASQGLTLEDVVKTTIFLTNLDDFARVNDVYGACFKADPPARSTVQVSALPRGVKVEIEAVAVLR